PELLIGESTARQLLAEAGVDLDQLKRSFDARERINVATGLQVRVRAGLAYDSVATANVVGYFPAADRETEGDRILVTASYGGPFLQEGLTYPGMDDDVSSVAVLMEVARLWNELGFTPKRTVVFAALNDGGGRYLVHHPVFPASVSDIWTMVTLQGVGPGGPDLARREAGGGLANAFDQSARRFGVRADELDNWRFFFTGGSERLGYVSSDQAYSGLAVVWSGDGDHAGSVSASSPGSLDELDQDSLAEIGQAVAHYLMVLSSR
ncbi:MAG: M28 family peptidase, partial [bacterium]|nr:M28 family peptidase [bacterium]